MALPSRERAFVWQDDPARIVARTEANSEGDFCLEVPPGTYTVKATAKAFKPAVRERVVVPESGKVNLGELALGFLGCDYAGVICDSIEPDGEKPPLKKGFVTLEPGCGLDLINGSATCDGTPSDVQLSYDAGELCLRPADGAPIPLEGLSLGDDFRLRTRKGHQSHLFLEDEVESGAKTVRFYFVTSRK